VSSQTELKSNSHVTCFNQPATHQAPDSPGKPRDSLAHDLGNPLLGIKALLQDFRTRCRLSREDAELLDIAINECSRLQAMINAMETSSSSGDAAPSADQK
jgi:nitrogen-specific signal transduction histidine kinase